MNTEEEAAPSQAAVEVPVHDPFLACLEYVAGWHKLELSREAVLAGLPLADGKLNPALLLRAAHRAGFRARLVERPVRRLPRSVLPAILLLGSNRAGVLVPGAGDSVELHIPGLPCRCSGAPQSRGHFQRHHPAQADGDFAAGK